MFGGAMRQVGILAAAGLYAIDRNVSRLAEDHDNARRIAMRISSSRRLLLDLQTVQTNILVVGLAPGAPDAPTVIARAKDRGVLLVAFGPHLIRLVTHLDVTAEQCERAAETLLEVIET
jgi:threonine aldolase